jgi:DNA-binding transcriptional ArsR family regulator
MGKLNRSRPDGLGRALHHPLRLRLLDLLLNDAASTPRALADATGEPVSRVSYHLGVLRECGIGEARPRGESHRGGSP